MKCVRVTPPTLSGWKNACAVFLFFAVSAIASSAQTFTVLLNFESSNGSGPNAPLVQGLDGNLYGTAWSGGTSIGTVFRMTPQGILSTIYDFCFPFCSDGANPVGLALTPSGSFYGTTEQGGNINCNAGAGCGTVFKVTPGGMLTTLHEFHISDGSLPSALVQASDGDFYGTTQTGGATNDGSVFKINAGGHFTTVYSFCSKAHCGDGANPVGLMLGTDGALYGTTVAGGVAPCGNGYSCGTIFRITTAGKLTTLYVFPAGGAQGWYPGLPLVQGADGGFYGATFEGGANNVGTIFKLTAPGKLTTLYSLCSAANCTDGGYGANLVQATDGNFYGTTPGGGDLSCGGFNFGCGTVFSLTPTGTLTTLHTFENTDGDSPEVLVQATDGNFYGVTPSGGDLKCYAGQGCGNVFRLSMGLGPFVKLVQNSGKVGQTGDILGQGFTGTTGVFLNGTPATFTVVSDTFIRATVPAGATTGVVTVTTPSGTLKSNVPFQVMP